MPDNQVTQPCALCGKFDCAHLTPPPVYTRTYDPIGMEVAVMPPQPADKIAVNLEAISAAIKSSCGKYIFSDLAEAQASLDRIMEQQGLPPGSIIVVDDLPKPPTIMELRMLDDLDVFEPVHWPAESLEVHTWELYYAERDCGSACTPNGCCGHEGNIPESLVIGHTELKFDDDLDEWQAREAIKVSNFLSRMIEDATELRKTAELIADSGDIQPGICDLGAKHMVRDRENLLRYIEKGYRIYLDLNAGVKFLRCPGKPDIIYDL